MDEEMYGERNPHFEAAMRLIAMLTGGIIGWGLHAAWIAYKALSV